VLQASAGLDDVIHDFGRQLAAQVEGHATCGAARARLDGLGDEGRPFDCAGLPGQNAGLFAPGQVFTRVGEGQSIEHLFHRFGEHFHDGLQCGKFGSNNAWSVPNFVFK